MLEQVKKLDATLEQLTNRLGMLQDAQEIRNLHHMYGYYFDSCLFNEVVDLFAENGEVRFMGGIFRGKEGVRRLYCGRLRERHTKGHNGPVYGLLLDHALMQDIIHVDPNRKKAYSRSRCFMQAGRHEKAEGETRQWWEGGLYENEYIQEGGVWKIKVLDYRGLWHADFQRGWAHTPPDLYPFYSTTYPEEPMGPDELMTGPKKPVLWPDTDVLPFHYAHPITGEKN